MQQNNVSFLQQICLHGWTIWEQVLLHELLNHRPLSQRQRILNKKTKEAHKHNTTEVWFCLWDPVKTIVSSSNRCIQCVCAADFLWPAATPRALPWKTALFIYIGTLLSHWPLMLEKRDRPVACSKVNICYNYTKARRDGILESIGGTNDPI